MKKRVSINTAYLASAVGVLMTRAGVNELKFTKEEYEEVVSSGQYIKLEGEFKEDNQPPEYLVFTLYTKEEYLKEMH